jgi:hypothetical protein
MPSITHEASIELIRQHPPLAAELVRLMTGVPLPGDDAVHVSLGSGDASNVIPAEHRADIVTVITDKVTRAPLMIVIVEPQGRGDRAKRFSWPAYLANLHDAHQCENAVLIVICWDEAEAMKCREAIPMGHPGYVLVPIVIGPHSSPEPRDGSPWLTLLTGAIGAIDLSTDDGCRTVLNAIAAADTDISVRRNLSTIMLGTASHAARARLEALMATTEFKSEFIDGIEARAAARAEAKSLLIILRSRGLRLTDEQRDLVTACLDAGQLEQWIDRAATATSVDEVFKD